MTASGSSSRRQTKDRLLPLSDISEFSLDSSSEALVSRETHPLICGWKSPGRKNIHKVRDLPPTLGRRLSDIATSPAPSYFPSSPRKGPLPSNPGGEWYDPGSAEDAGDSHISEKTEALPSRSLSLIHILLTVWPSLLLKHKPSMVPGFTATLFHAASTPAFSYALARLLGSILGSRIPEPEARRWSLHYCDCDCGCW